MAKFRLSRLAEADLIEIGSYTLRIWGEEQTVRYVESIEACCQQLADNPELGRCLRLRLARFAPHGTRIACRVLPDRAGSHRDHSHPSQAHAAGKTAHRVKNPAVYRIVRARNGLENSLANAVKNGFPKIPIAKIPPNRPMAS